MFPRASDVKRTSDSQNATCPDPTCDGGSGKDADRSAAGFQNSGGGSLQATWSHTCSVPQPPAQVRYMPSHIFRRTLCNAGRRAKREDAATWRWPSAPAKTIGLHTFYSLKQRRVILGRGRHFPGPPYTAVDVNALCSALLEQSGNGI